MAWFLFSRDRRRSRVVRSGFGDGSTVGLERDVVGLGALLGDHEAGDDKP